jgi:two-component system OmpR family response regulator
MAFFEQHDLDAPRRADRRTILAIDDSRTNLTVLGRRLEHYGYTAMLSDNGPEALDLIAARGVDLVLLDMVMPRMSGMHILEKIRGRCHSADLPVIMLTGRSDPAAAVQALAAGADDHVAKPFDFEVLAARIDHILGRARRIADLKRSNATLDALVAARASDLGQVQSALAATRADRARLVASIHALNDEIDRLNANLAN